MVDQDGKAVADTDVFLTADTRAGDPLETFAGRSRTSADGRFAFDDVAAGTYRTAVSALPMPGGAVANAPDPSARTGVSGGVVAGIVGPVPGGVVVSRDPSGRIDPRPVVVVTDADVSAVRVVVRRPNPR